MKKVIVYSVLLVASVALWCFTHRESAKVQRVFDSIEKLAAKEPGESVLECAAKSQALARYFKDGCTIIDIGHGLKTSYSCEDIAGGLLAFRSGATKIAVSFHELEISVNGAEARVDGWIDYSGTEAIWPRLERESEKFIARLEKIEGQWLISRIKAP